MDAPPPPPHDGKAEGSFHDAPDSAPAYVMAAVVGGLFAGVLSGGCGTSCCCAPLFGGIAGILAAMTASRPAFLFGPAEGAIAGAAAGAAGAVLSALITIPMQLVARMLLTNPQFIGGLPPEMRQPMQELAQQLQRQGPLELVIPIVLGAGVLFVSCVVGGAIGGLIRRKDGGAY